MRLLPLAVAVALVLGAAPAEGQLRGRRGGGCRLLPNGVRLPVRGPGWQIPTTWATRGLSYGTPELVGLIRRTARRLARAVPTATLYVADLSPRGGGRSRWHRTHRTGVDVDILLFARDAAGHPAEPGPVMVPFDCEGRSFHADGAGHPYPTLTLDVERSWALVRAVVEDRQAQLAEILIANCLRHRLLAHARAVGAPRGVIARAERLMRQPRVSPHNDHIHVRVTVPETPCLARAPVAHPRTRRAARRR